MSTNNATTESPMKPRIAVFAGMPRAGTTFLYHNLQKHPQLIAPYRKELNFFNNHFENGPPWFEEFFDAPSPDALGLDISPLYFFDRRCPERIAAYDPDLRVVIGVREPVSFAASWYAQYCNTHHDHPPDLESFVTRIDQVFGVGTDEVSLTSGRIVEMIRAYSEALGPRLMLYSYDTFCSDRLTVVRAIESHLSLASHFDESNFDDVVINAGERPLMFLWKYLQSERFVRAVRLLPRPLVAGARGLLERLSASKSKSAPTTPVAWSGAEEHFAEDRAYCESLFSRGGIVLGDGSIPFEIETSTA